jgi:hypothetical protein
MRAKRGLDVSGHATCDITTTPNALQVGTSLMDWVKLTMGQGQSRDPRH